MSGVLQECSAYTILKLTGECMSMKLKNCMAKLYFKIINIMHRPFVKQGAEDPYHAIFRDFISLTKQAHSPSIIEIGSRNVTGITRRDLFSHCEEYVGFDILAGDGVDIVGDAHKLSENCHLEHFDFVFSISLFEHLLFPWKVVMEINKVMKSGGYLFVSTHPTWPAHELPWDYWRFPCNGFYALFNKYTGFEIVSITEGLPCKIYSLVDDALTRSIFLPTVNQGVALIARKTGMYRSDLLKWDIEVADIVNTMYPSNKSS
jgi:SAM-dependent methyltransferase